MKTRNSLLIVMALALLSGCGRSENVDPVPVPGPVVPPAPACLPLEGPIGFTGTAYFDSSNLIGGQVPAQYLNPYLHGKTGQLTIAPGAGGGAMAGSGIDGTISVGLTPVAEGQANITGVIQLSPQGIQDMRLAYQQRNMSYGFGFSYGYGYGYGYQNPTQAPMEQLCVTNVAIDMRHYHNWIYGVAYLFINGTQTGVILKVQ